MKKIIIIIAAVVAAAIIGVVVWFMASKKDGDIKYNEGYVNGSTAGNLYNSGLFCEHDGVVYFSNPDDNMKLYSMNVDGSDVKKESEDIALFINADDNYVYYVRSNRALTEMEFFSFFTNSLVRMSRKTGNVVVLDTDPCMYCSLVGNYIYYLKQASDDKPTTTFKIGIDRKNGKEVKGNYSFTCSTLGQYIYYNGILDGRLLRNDTATDMEEDVFDCNCYKPIAMSENDIYYMNVDHNNCLFHVNPSSGIPTQLTEESVDHYNTFGSYIYYQSYDPINGNALCMVRNDGTGKQIIAKGDFYNINVTSTYLYFMDYKSREIFRAPITNPSAYELFHPGFDD